jgi:hypothetical protein
MSNCDSLQQYEDSHANITESDHVKQLESQDTRRVLIGNEHVLMPGWIAAGQL